MDRTVTREPDEGRGDAEGNGRPCGDGAGPPCAGGSDAARLPDDEFDRIVAAWRAEGSVPDWPDAPAAPAGPTGSTSSGAPAAPPPTEPAAVHRPGPAGDAEDDHYHPPEPPPLPRPGPPAVVGAGLIILGLLLIAVPGTLGLSGLYGLPLGLLGIAAGLTWLVMRMWPSADAEDHRDDDGDDGAVL